MKALEFYIKLGFEKVQGYWFQDTYFLNVALNKKI